ncbi:MAG: TlyA family RNA methyltransferase [Acidimicrobiales bacterium]
MTTRRRLDAELVRRRLATSRAHAVELVGAGRVLVGGAPADRASRLVAAGEPLEVLGPPPRFVSRAGAKLDAAIARFGVDVAGRRCLDAGASTGGFTDCLLQRGAAVVHAVDVGRGQLHERLRSDRRVVVHERTNIRTATLPGLFQEEGFDVVVADLSFISLRAVAGRLVELARPGGDLVVLVKPQFEVGRQVVSRGRGVVRDEQAWGQALLGAITALQGAGAAMMGLMVSPVRGADGNVEFLAHLSRAGAPPPGGTADVERAVAAAVAAVGSAPAGV